MLVVEQRFLYPGTMFSIEPQDPYRNSPLSFEGLEQFFEAVPKKTATNSLRTLGSQALHAAQLVGSTIGPMTVFLPMRIRP